jgi:hypothetical protein
LSTFWQVLDAFSHTDAHMEICRGNAGSRTHPVRLQMNGDDLVRQVEFTQELPGAGIAAEGVMPQTNGGIPAGRSRQKNGKVVKTPSPCSRTIATKDPACG